MSEDHNPAVPPWSSVAEALEARGLLEGVASVVLAHHATMFEACGTTRSPVIVAARHAAWAHLKKLGFSYPEIGRLWGVAHTTVHTALRKPRKKR